MRRLLKTLAPSLNVSHIFFCSKGAWAYSNGVSTGAWYSPEAMEIIADYTNSNTSKHNFTTRSIRLACSKPGDFRCRSTNHATSHSPQPVVLPPHNTMRNFKTRLHRHIPSNLSTSTTNFQHLSPSALSLVSLSTRYWILRCWHDYPYGPSGRQGCRLLSPDLSVSGGELMNERSAADEGAVKLFHGNGSVGLKAFAFAFVLWRRGMRERGCEMIEE